MRSYGCKLHDRRPERFALAQTPLWHSLPPAIEYRQIFGAIEDQGDFSTCVAHGTKAMLDAVIGKHTKSPVATSWRGIYSLTKWTFEGADLRDDGLMIEDALNAISSRGYVLESAWTDENITESNLLLEVPPLDLVKFDTIAAWQRVAIGSDALMRALVAKGPIGIGVDWPYEWEMVGPDGVLPGIPVTSAGGHFVVLTGYAFKGSDLFFHLRNSWGTQWGVKGYGWMPESAISRIANAYAIHIP